MLPDQFCVTIPAVWSTEPVREGVGTAVSLDRMTRRLEQLSAGMPIIYGGDRVTEVSPELAAAFQAGDRLVVVQTSGDLLHIPEVDWDTATGAVGRAHGAFAKMGAVSDDQISEFFETFAQRLVDDASFAPIAAANATDVERAAARGRSTTRLVLADKMRSDMVAGLRMWAGASAGRGEIVRTVDHDGWSLDQLQAGLGAVGFVFEGRPNVFADAAGVIRSGNTVVFRIGSDALGTARAIVEHALDPALEAAGLPEGAASLVDSEAHAAGHAMFSDDRLALAVARGSGPAVAQLGAVARQAGIPVSLHGTGGAWVVAGETADPERLRQVIHNSLDRKVCNTVNTCVVPSSRAHELVPVVLEALDTAGVDRGAVSKLHVVGDHADLVPDDWFDEAPITRAQGVVNEPRTERVEAADLGHEWEWEDSPEITLTVADSVEEAAQLFNEHSPQFVASLVSEDEAEHDRFYSLVNAPFVGDGFTRWVDGQYALNSPELGLSNWQFGRLFGRGGVLSGDSVFTIRTRMRQEDLGVRR